MKTAPLKPIVMSRQRGAALFIALIALVSMTLAAIALMRSVDTTNLIAGNLAFRQAALHIAELGVEDAVAYINQIPKDGMDQQRECNGVCRYYPVIQGNEQSALPNVDLTQAYLSSAGASSGYQIRYVIDRLCSSTAVLPITNIRANCYTDTSAANFRITVRVNGPRNTVTLVQAVYRR